MYDLVGLDLLITQRAGIGGFNRQLLDVHQQRGHFGQGAFGSGDDIRCAFGVAYGPGDTGHFRAQGLRGNEPGRVIGAAGDAQAAAETLQRGAQVLVGTSQVPLSDNCRDVGIDPGHGNPP